MTVGKKDGLTVKSIRNVNTENLLQCMLQNRSTTRSILAKENQISLMTVKHVVDDLLAAGILAEKESANADVGRNPKMLEIAENYGNIVCVNLTSKDEIAFLIYDIYENLLAEGAAAFAGGDYRSDLTAVFERIGEKVREIGTETVGIAVFVPSAYNQNIDQVNYDLIPGFKDLHVRALFEKEFGIDNILILHDVFAAAQSEYDHTSPAAESQFYFYCGYGVGGCFIHGGEAVQGEENMAGEVGKMLVSMDGSEKGYGILEDYVSISAIKEKMKERGMDMSFTELLESCRAGGREALELMEPVLYTIARVLYNLLWVYNPTRLVIDSCREPYSRMIAERFLGFLETMQDEAIPIHTEVRQARYDEYRTMRGCFYMARNAWIEKIAACTAG